MRRHPFILAVFIGGLVTLLIDILVDLLFFNKTVSQFWLGESLTTAILVITVVILLTYSIPGYIAACIGKKGREISTGVSLALLATPLIAYFSIQRSSSAVDHFDPSQILVYFGVALALVIGAIIRAVQMGSFKRNS